MSDEESVITDDASESLLGTSDSVKTLEQNKNNFPVCFPMMQHDIASIHHAGLRRLVRVAYFAWYATFVIFFWNLVAVTSVLLYGGGVLNFMGVILAIVYLFLGPTVAFFAYKFMYDSAKSLSIAKLSMHYCVFGCYVLFCMFLGLGIPHSGGSGLVTMVQEEYSGDTVSHSWSAFFNLLSLLVWGAYCSYCIYSIVAIRSYINAASKETLPDMSTESASETLDSAFGDEKDDDTEQGFVYSKQGSIISPPPRVARVAREPEPVVVVQPKPAPALISISDDVPDIPKEFL